MNTTSRRFDAPTNFKTSNAASEMRKTSAKKDEAVESPDLWDLSVPTNDADNDVEKARRESQERTLNAWKPKTK